MNTVILGASGFLGQSITSILAEENADLTLFDMHFTETQKEKYRCVVGDFSSPADLEPILTNEVDTVIHLISTTVPATGDKYPGADVRGNLITTLDFLDLCVKNRIRRVIFASSGGTVYGSISRPAEESDPCNPICSYGIVKRAIEEYLALYHRLHGLEYSILRASNPYGTGQAVNKPQGVIGAFLCRILEEKPIEIWGDGSVVRDFIHIDDVAKAFAAVMKYRGPERIFNVGTGVGHSIKDVIGIIENVTGREVPCTYRQQKVQDVPMNVLDVSKIKDAVGWMPEIGLREGISHTYKQLLGQALELGYG